MPKRLAINELGEVFGVAEHEEEAGKCDSEGGCAGARLSEAIERCVQEQTKQRKRQK